VKDEVIPELSEQIKAKIDADKYFADLRELPLADLNFTVI